MSKDTEYIATLIEFTVSEDNERVDLEACLEIADRANATKPECNEAIKSIAKCLGKSNMKIVVNTLQLLETMCKNCNQRFLYELNNKKLVDAMLKILQRRRDKAKYGTKITKSSNQLKAEAEDRALYLLQLWADTFMMHQAEFRNIHDAYRNLRKDSVMFPERDPNQKFMINFQGQTSPVFLAMEGNVAPPANNQGGPISDSRRSTTTNQYKPKNTEYKHEYANNVQNTLYDENDEDYDYSAYDGIQITAEEVRILEESMGILREIERNATKPADMKGDIAKEILSDLVHVHKRLKRFITSEKFASPAHKNEAIRLNQVLSSCLSSYKTKYYKLKDEIRQIKTEPAEDFRARYKRNEDDDELPKNSKNVQRLATEYDEGSYTERIKPSDLGAASKKKITFTGNNKLAPPSGWKAPTQDLAPNPDLIDLLNTRDAAPTKPVQKQQQPTKKVEETKEDPNKRVATTPDLLTDLLDLNFGSPQPKAQGNANGGVVNKNQNQQIHTDMGSSKKDDFFDFGNFGSPTPKKPNVLSPSKGVVQPQFMSSTPKKPIAQPQFNNPPPVTEPNVPVKNLLDDDDDFFSDIANRKK